MTTCPHCGEELEVKLEKKELEPLIKEKTPTTTPVILRCDGACMDNPSIFTGVGMALIKKDEVIAKWGACTDAATNNEAEYSSIIQGLIGALDRDIKNIRVLNDNKLVVNQINGSWRTKAKNLKPFLQKARKLLQQFDSWVIKWVPRKENDLVDGVAKKYSRRAFHRKQN